MKSQKLTTRLQGEQHFSWFQRVTNCLRRLIDACLSQPYQYTSSRRLFGLPLWVINLGPSLPDGTLRHARGLVVLGTSATGVIAFGLVRAQGVLAVAPLVAGVFCVGVGSIGLVSVAVLGLGGVSVSVFAFGYLAVGILAIGIKSVGIVALGWEAIGIVAFGKTVRAMMSR